MTLRSLSLLTLTLALILLAFGLREGVRQHRENSFILAATNDALSRTSSSDLGLKVTALRDFIRARVSSARLSARNRPFLRHSAADTLESGAGRCGEVTRLFINMASAAGISAHRLYLEGKKPHVVAVVVADDGSKLVVDSSDRPYLPEIVSFENLQHNPQFTSFSTLGFRRLSLLRALPSHDLNLGPLNYLLENPHALIACLLLLPSVALFGLTFLMRRRIFSRSHEVSERELPIIGGLGEGAEI